jgi:hypothetical protein
LRKTTRSTAEKLDNLADAQVEVVQSGTALENSRQTNVWLQLVCQQLLDIQRRLDGIGLMIAQRLPADPPPVKSNSAKPRAK